MQRFASTVAVLSFSLWFGGLIALFMFVQVLFAHDREVAVLAAPQLFLVFQKYQLIVAAIALAATVGWRITVPSKAIVTVFILLGAATVAAVAVGLFYIGPMEQLRLSGQSSSPEFRRMHGQSMILYVCEAVLLAASGIILPFALVGTSRETAGAKDSPA